MLRKVAFASFLMCWLPAVAHAQLVQIGPGYVRAPFVRVVKFPDGSTQVRAPFVDVRSTARYYVGNPQWQQPQAATDWNRICQSGHHAVHSLNQQLRSFPTGNYWAQRLSIVELSGILQPGVDQPMNAATRARVQQIQQDFDSIKSNGDLAAISNLQSFRQTANLLRDLVSFESSESPEQNSAISEELPVDLLPVLPAQSFEELPEPPMEIPNPDGQDQSSK